MSGYYAWQDTPNGKQPWYFTARDGSPALTAAGLWDSWKNPETGEPLLSCALIITEPDTMVSRVHDRNARAADGEAARAVAQRRRWRRIP